MQTIRIERKTETVFSALTNVPLSDGTFQGDSELRLLGSDLVSVERPGLIRVGGLFRVQMGPQTLASVQRLAVGEFVVVRFNAV